MQQINLLDVTGRAHVAADYGVAKRTAYWPRPLWGHPYCLCRHIAPFAALDLEKKPAMFLGMDALRKFDRMAIDFANRKIYFLLPEDAT